MIFLITLLVLSPLSIIILFFSRERKFVDHCLPKLPQIAILIAVRNEERNLPALFRALLAIDYPPEKLQILLGNDQSTDNSRTLIEEFCKINPNAKFVDIVSSSQQIAKANVLMQLAQLSNGDYYYFVDADMRPDPEILYSYLKKMCPSKAGITGITLPIAHNWFAKMQQIDWVYALSMAVKAQGLGFDTTAMGNNMFLSRQEYRAIGGYEALPKSLVEDYTLYKAIRAKKRDFPVVFSKKLLSFTQPIRSVWDLLMQRKRWMTGGLKLHWFLQSLLVTQGVYFPVFLLGLFFFTKVALGVALLKLILQSCFLMYYYTRIGQKVAFYELLSYEIYNSLFTSVLLVFYLLPIKYNWKNRKYGHY
jgi:cellulose synthase/poly-beta-1,6-N-acetylglucosamine synthase-like glycosyltransferase